MYNDRVLIYVYIYRCAYNVCEYIKISVYLLLFLEEVINNLVTSYYMPFCDVYIYIYIYIYIFIVYGYQLCEDIYVSIYVYGNESYTLNVIIRIYIYIYIYI